MSDPLGLLGIRLQLLVGPTIPIPAPYPLIDALTGLEVTNRDQQRDGFQMNFSLGKDSPVDYTLLNGILDPPSRVIITVIIGGVPQVLIDGIITTHQFVPSNKPGESTLVVTGDDISLKLDLEEKNAIYPNQPDSVIVTGLLDPYAIYGLTPVVTPTTNAPPKEERVPTQQGTDLAHIQELAQRNGFVFYIEPQFPFVNTAYWGLDNRLGLAQPALSMNMGPDTNVDSLNFSFDALGPATPEITIISQSTKLPITIPLPNGLRPPLVARPATSLRKTIPRDTANQSFEQASLLARSTSSATSDAVTASGELDTVRYGHVLRARRLVGVRGVGLNYDGNYYVQQVTHQIKRGEYKQSFTLSREGHIPLTPLVVP